MSGKHLDVTEEVSLQFWIDTSRQQGEQQVNIARKFVGSQNYISLQDYLTQGYILLELGDQFYSKIQSNLV